MKKFLVIVNTKSRQDVERKFCDNSKEVDAYIKEVNGSILNLENTVTVAVYTLWAYPVVYYG